MTSSNSTMDQTAAPQTLLVGEERANILRQESLGFQSLTLSQRQLCDLELLLNGGFAPLDGFMDRRTYDSVLEQTRLPTGALWPIPIVLDIGADLADKLAPGQQLALRDQEGFMPAVLTVSELWEADKEREANLIYGTDSLDHPGVRYLKSRIKGVYVAGALEGIQLPTHHDFENLWNTPQELRHQFAKTGWRNVLAFQTTNPMHKLERRLVIEAAKENQAHILIHPAVGETKPGDLHYYGRVRCYKAIARHLPHEMSTLSLLPLAMRMAGPREALWHALVNRNYGCSHLIMGPDHGSPPLVKQQATRFYPRYAAAEYVQGFGAELGIQVVPLAEHRYVPSKQTFLPADRIEKESLESVSIDAADLRGLLLQGKEIPDWFSYPEVLEELRRVYPRRSRQGITIFFTGLSGSGKSTLANIIYAKLVEAGGRPVSLLDGDIVRQHLSSELGFSKTHRDLNIRRIGFVASEITKNGGIAICAPIAPYTETRRAVREMVEAQGAFIEIHVSTPLEVCESRDRKGLYAKARKGIIPEFTGISDPYEVPENPEMRIDTSKLSPTEAAQAILLYLFKEGYLDDEA